MTMSIGGDSTGGNITGIEFRCEWSQRTWRRTEIETRLVEMFVEKLVEKLEGRTESRTTGRMRTGETSGSLTDVSFSPFDFHLIFS